MLLYAVIYFAVSIFWVFFFIRMGGGLRAGTVWRVFVYGLLAGPLAGILSLSIQQAVLGGSTGNHGLPLEEFILYFAVVGPVEEGAKFLAVVLAALRRTDFRGSVEGILLGVIAALGFAGGENVLYMTSYGVAETLPRLILGNLGHAAYSVFWGYALGVVMHENAPFSLILSGLTIASLAHGAYNFFLTRSIWGAMISLGLSALLFWFLFAFLRSEIVRRR